MGLVNNQKAYDRYLIDDKQYGNIVLNNEAIGFRFALRMPNFRGNYLSCVEQLTVTLDNVEIAEPDIEVLLNNKRFRISEFPDMYKEYWDVNDYAIVEVTYAGGLQGKHELGVTMRLRYGYSAYFGVCKVVTSHSVREFDFGA